VIEARTEHLSSRPGEANLDVAVASLASGTTLLRAVTLVAKARAQDLSLEIHIAEPQAVSLIATGRLDEDHSGLAIERLALTYPGAGWTTAEIARLRFGGDRLSLANLRLVSEGQSLAVNGSKTDAQVDAQLSIDGLRLDLLPTALIDPNLANLHLGGALDVQVKADGALDRPHVAAQVRLQHGRYQGFTKLGAQLKGTLTDHQIDGTVQVDAPFAALNAGFKLRDDPLAAGAPLDLRLEVTRLDLAEALRGAAVAAHADGRVTASLRVNGSADSPQVDLLVNGRDLQISPPAPAKPPAPGAKPAAPTETAAPAVAHQTSEPIDVGHARLHLTYADRAAHADVDFASAQGGSLRVDAGAHVDLSYPRVTRGLVVAKLPVHGKVVARGFNVSWLAAFNERLESMGGQVDADARLAGTVGDPQFVGDVRWKNGKVVANVAKPPVPARR
jgi:autotransporter translocation and assembly factor TamB